MAKRNRSIDRSTIGIFWRAILDNKKYLWLALLYPIGTILLNTVTPLYVGKILAALAYPERPISKLVVIFAVAGALGVLFNRMGFTSLMTFQAKAMSSLQTQAFWTLLKRSVGFHNNNISGKLVSDAIEFPQAFSMLSNAVIVNILPLVITLTVGIVIVMSASLALGLIVAAMAIFTVASGIMESRYRRPLRQRRLVATKAVTGHLADTVVNAQTVKTFAQEERELKDHKRLNGILRQMRVSDWRSAATAGNNRMAVLFVLQLIYILLVVNAVHHNPALLGIGIFAFSFTISLSNRLFEINSLIRNIEDGLLQASPMTEIFLQEVEVTDQPNAKDLRVKKGEIIFDNVDFQYSDGNKKDSVFQGLNLEIKPGEKVGLVGRSGGGKTTLTRLLLRFEDVIDGTVEIDKQNIEKVTQASLRESVAYVPQEPLLFHRSISENIAYGKQDATEAEIRKVANWANADSFIEKLPNQYDTVVGERGVKLSGGQRQRVAIARAMLKDAPILVLDEATSALDSESEKLIQAALWKLMEGRTSIVIAHRLSTIQRMDRIVVLEEGKIVEDGSHKELLEADGTYAKLWAHQSGGFLED